MTRACSSTGTASGSPHRPTTRACSRPASCHDADGRRVSGLTMRDRLPTIALVAGILLAWEAYVRLAGVAPVVLPSPTRIIGALWEYRDDAARHALPTLLETVVGFLL